jgi:tmRNA-binding protein
VKVLVGLARGKQSHDKRHAIAERQVQRDLQRVMSRKVMR